jgi:hypothetical protein
MKTIKTITLFAFLLLLTIRCGEDSVLNAISADKPTAITAKNIPPISNAGVDQTITLPTSTVSLDGTKSSDKDGRISSWKWSKKSGPTQYTLTTPTASKTDATTLAEGVYVFTLTVTDNRDGAATDDVQITVLKGATPPPPTPTLTAFSPTSGLVGASVTITGTNFTSPTVSFNGTPATVTASTTTSITTTVPNGATTGTISVTSNGTTVYSANTFTVTVAPPPPTGETYFVGDMQNVTVTRSGSGYKLNGWANLYSQVNDIYLNNLATADTYAYQQMVTDPAGSGRTVMMGRILDSDPSQPATSRAQMTISYKSTTNLPVYHSSHRMYIHPDLKYLEQYPGVADWFSLVEIWTVRDPNMDGDPAGSARWGLSLHKSSATGSPLFWHLYGEYMQPASKKYQDFWAYDNKSFAVPFGQWFTLDIYLKRGTGVNGQFKITVTPDGGTTTTVFDVSGDTQYPNRTDLYLDDWQPFKLYIGDTWMDWMRGNGKYMAIYYNDYKWYKN